MGLFYLIGGFIGATLIFQFFHWIVYKVLFRKRISKKEASVPAFILSAIFIFIVHVPHFELDGTFKYLYLPSLAVWFIYERFLNKKDSGKEGKDEIEIGESGQHLQEDSRPEGDDAER